MKNTRYGKEDTEIRGLSDLYVPEETGDQAARKLAPGTVGKTRQ
jgi:hypothetical protein